MTIETFIKAELARVSWLEAGHCGGSNNLTAHAFMLRNRVRAGWGTWATVLSNYQQYSPIASEMPAMPDLADTNFRIFLQKIDDIYSGGSPDTFTEGALYSCELNRVTSAWFRDNVLQSRQEDEDGTMVAVHRLIAQVGQVHFYA